MADDYLLQAVTGALQGVASVYVPWKQREHEDFLTRRRKGEELAGEEASALRRKRGEAQIGLEYLPQQERIKGEAEIAKETGISNIPVEMRRATGELAGTTAKGAKFLAAPPVTTPQTGGEKAVDRIFAKEYVDYIAGGGFADTMTQISSLEGVLTDLETGKKNLTGPAISMQPDFARKRFFPESMAAQQTVEQSVQRTLKKTLGGQFTEREGVLFMQRGYDPALSEKENSGKLKRTIGQLKMMAAAKQKAVDYYEENGTLKGFKGTVYTLKDGEMVEADKNALLKMIGGGVPEIGQEYQGSKVKRVTRVK